MPDKPPKLPIRPQSSRREIASHINKALKSSDIGAICRAIGDATRLHNISDIAKKAGIERPSVYRAFAGQQFPNLSAVVSVLDAIGFQLRVTQRGGTARKVSKIAKSEARLASRARPLRSPQV